METKIKHTADWKIEKQGFYNKYKIYNDDLDSICRDLEKSNAKRIVACVNACAGFSEAELETLGHYKAMHETIVAENNALRKQISEMESYVSSFLGIDKTLSPNDYAEFFKGWNKIIGVSVG